MQPAKYIPAILATFLFISCASNNQPKESLGVVDLEVTGSSAAQPAFKQGLLYLHSFEYEDAAEAFQNAQKTDPGFVMAYWGEAMTYNHPLWREQNYEQGNAVLNKLSVNPEERVAKAKSLLEKDFIKGINILYGTGNKTERDSSYAAFMATLYQKYPGNNEVAAFYSLSLIGKAVTGRQTKVFEQAAGIAKEVIERNPLHPGALHYIIHAYDDPEHATLALSTADKYAKVAPDAGHALHMPTHTYLALGMWDKVVSSNIVSWAAEKDRKERKKLNNDALGYHSYHWLLYGYLQQGKTSIARSMVDSMQQYCTELPSPAARSHMIYLKATYLAETGDYDKEVTGISFEQKDLNVLTRARNYFVTGMAAYHQKNEVELDKIIRQMAGERLIEKEKTNSNDIRVCGSINRSMPTLADLQKTEVMELQLKAMQAWMKKDAATTEKYLKQATALETSSTYAYGPPNVVKPSYEMYGEWLLQMNRPKEALLQFEKSLESAPNKLLSIKGKETALSLLKDPAKSTAKS